MVERIRMLYIGNDSEGREIVDFLKQHEVPVRVFTCEDNERAIYDCLSLLTTEGHFRGRKMIENYVTMLPAFASLEAA